MKIDLLQSNFSEKDEIEIIKIQMTGFSASFFLKDFLIWHLSELHPVPSSYRWRWFIACFLPYFIRRYKFLYNKICQFWYPNILPTQYVCKYDIQSIDSQCTKDTFTKYLQNIFCFFHPKPECSKCFSFATDSCILPLSQVFLW